MSDISVEFATNADLVAGQIDNAERSTNKATQTAELFNRSQRGVHETATIATRSLRGLGEAGRLFSIAGSGMAREAGGLIHILTSLGGPVGLAAGAAIGAIGIGMHLAAHHAEELKKAAEEAAKAFEALTKAKDDAAKAAASEGESAYNKYGKSLRAAAFGDIAASPSATEQKLIERGMSPEDAAGIAASRQRYKDNGGMLGGPDINNSFNWRSQDPNTQRAMMSIRNMNEQQSPSSDRFHWRMSEADSQKGKLASGDYIDAIKETANNTKDMVREFKDLNGQASEQTQKANTIQSVPMTFLEKISYGCW